MPGQALAVEMSDGRHAMRGDEPPDAGGIDLGPSPYELLLASLGSCASMTMFLYARRKEWPLESVSIELTHDKIHARDCPECTPAEIEAAGPQGRIDYISVSIDVTGELDEEQVARLLEISERCPVHRTLLAQPKIVSSIQLVAQR
jgi:putative redox protein